MAVAFARSGAADADATGYDADGTTGHFALQDAAKGIVAVDRVLGAGEPPRRRLFHALVADERFGEWQDLRVGATPVATPCEFGSTGTVFMRRGSVFVAVRPLYANAVGPRARFGIVSRAAGHLNIAVHMQDAATPLPVAGARLEAALAVAAAESADWPSYDAFIADFLAADSARVDEAATSRTVRWNLHGAIEFDFSRTAPGFTRREVRGAPTPDELALSEFAVQPAVGDIALRDLFVAGMPPASWAVYPPRIGHRPARQRRRHHGHGNQQLAGGQLRTRALRNADAAAPGSNGPRLGGLLTAQRVRRYSWVRAGE